MKNGFHSPGTRRWMCRECRYLTTRRVTIVREESLDYCISDSNTLHSTQERHPQDRRSPQITMEEITATQEDSPEVQAAEASEPAVDSQAKSRKGTENPELLAKKSILISSVRVEESCHIRDFDEATVKEYQRLIEDGGEMDPIDVIEEEDGEFAYYLTAGNNRIEAHKRAGYTKIQANIWRADHTQALIQAIESNSRHGLKLTGHQKREAVRMCLNDKTIRRWSDRRIARTCGVSPQIVQEVRSGKTKTKASPAAAPAAEVPQQSPVVSAAPPAEEPRHEAPAGPMPVVAHERSREMPQKIEDRIDTIRQWMKQDYMDWQTLVEIINSERSDVSVIGFPIREFEAVVRLADGATRTYSVSNIEFTGGRLMLEAAFQESDELDEVALG